MSEPRVTAERHIDAVSTRRVCDRDDRTTPDVYVRVEFVLGDHEAALEALRDAVADVEAQIETAADIEYARTWKPAGQVGDE